MYEDKAIPCCSSPQEQEEEISYVDSERFLSGTIETVIGQVPLVKAELTSDDKIGSLKARWGV
jgi:hypothetical protein